MMTHSALGLPAHELDIVIIDPSQYMRTLFHSMVHPLQIRRQRSFELAAEAFESMLVNPPNLIIADWDIADMSGFRFLRVLRSKGMAPLCFIPVIMMSARATLLTVEKGLRAGAQMVLAKPISQNTLQERINWILNDDRKLAFDEKQCIILPEATAIFDKNKALHTSLNAGRYYQKQLKKRSVKELAHELFEVSKESTLDPIPSNDEPVGADTTLIPLAVADGNAGIGELGEIHQPGG